MTRWDSPLFSFHDIFRLSGGRRGCGQDRGRGGSLDDIWNAAVLGSVSKAPEVVAPTRSTTANYLSLLESSTQAVVSCILQHQSSLGLQPGTSVPISHESFAAQSSTSLHERQARDARFAAADSDASLSACTARLGPNQQLGNAPAKKASTSASPPNNKTPSPVSRSAVDRIRHRKAIPAFLQTAL